MHLPEKLLILTANMIFFEVMAFESSKVDSTLTPLILQFTKPIVNNNRAVKIGLLILEALIVRIGSILECNLKTFFNLLPLYFTIIHRL